MPPLSYQMRTVSSQVIVAEMGVFRIFLFYTQVWTIVYGITNWKKMAQDELLKSVNFNSNTKSAKNVILFVGDGMGVSTVTAARILKGQMQGNPGEETVLSFEEFPFTGFSKTYCNDYQTSDSAATATAFMCGVKTNYYTLGLDDTAIMKNCSHEKAQNREVSCIAEWFRDDGRSVGLVTTARITHATPGAAYAKTSYRSWEGDVDMVGVEGGCTDVAQQLVFNNSFIKVLFGGGRRSFLPNDLQDPDVGYGSVDKQRRDGLNLIEKWKQDKEMRRLRAKYVWNKEQFDAIDPDNTDYALGLFSSSHMEHVLDKKVGQAEKPTLAEMTEKAIKMLQKDDQGFFLMVEETHIDKAHHDSLAKKALYGVLQLEEAVRKAVSMTSEEDTLIVVTADHSHVFNIAGYPTRGNNILGVVKPGAKHKPKDGIPWTTLLYGIGPGYDWGKRVDNNHVDTTDKEFIQAAAVPRSSETHGGEDVAIYARGPMAHLIHGVHEQHYIAHVMAYAACVGENKGHCGGHQRRAFILNDAKKYESSVKNILIFSLFFYLSVY